MIPTIVPSMLHRVRFVPLLCLAACGVPDAAGDVEGAMKAYVPGLRVGAPVADADPRYRLAVVPELGPLVVYADSAYRHASGMEGLLVAVDQILLDETQRPSREALIRSVALSTAEAKIGLRVEADLRERLGEPRVWCVQLEPGQQHRFLYWGGAPHPTVSLSMPGGAWQPGRDAAPGTRDIRGRAWLSFSAEPPDTAQLQSQACPPNAGASDTSPGIFAPRQ